MKKPIAFDEIMSSLPSERRASIEKRGTHLVSLVEKRMTLAQIRKRRSFTQAKVAEALGIGQAQVSRLERETDPRLSTIHKTVAALGGSLKMVITFPGQEPIILTPLDPDAAA